MHNHDQQAGHSVAMFRDKFRLSLALTLPVVFWSTDVQRWFGYRAPSFPGSQWIPPILGTVVFLYGGMVFLKGALAELASRKPGMMSLISLAIVVAFGTSAAATFGLFQIDVWWELASLITIMVLGHWLEMQAISQARGALDALASLLPDVAERVTGQETQAIPISQLRLSDIVLVRPGGRVPADGVVIEGSADVDESMITGESTPVSKQTGSNVIAGTVISGGSLHVKVAALGEQTALSGIMRLVAAAQSSGSRAQALADRAAAALFYVAIASGAATFAFWWFAGQRENALIRTATVLSIACPHALGLAIPLVVAISTSMGARSGLLVKDRLALETARNLDVVIFDKTGTLTSGTPVVSAVSAVSGISEDAMLAEVAAVESNSEHPLAKAIMAEAKRRGVALLPAHEFEALPGRGGRAVVAGAMIQVGGPRLLTESAVAVPAEIEAQAVAWASDGKTVLYATADAKLIGAFAVEDEIRPESRAAIAALHRLGVTVAMLTGDSKTVAESVGRRLGIDHVRAEVLPADKAAAVKAFQAGGKRVAMVGDGVNDAPALATADVGIAIGAGTDVAIESAGIVLLHNDPQGVVDLMRLSRATYRKMIQNLAWATGIQRHCDSRSRRAVCSLGTGPSHERRRCGDELIDYYRGGERATSS